MHLVQVVLDEHSKQPPLAEHVAQVAELAELAAYKKYFYEHPVQEIGVEDDPPHLLHCEESCVLAPAYGGQDKQVPPSYAPKFLTHVAQTLFELVDVLVKVKHAYICTAAMHVGVATPFVVILTKK